MSAMALAQSTVLAKTSKGQREVAGREFGLSIALRRVLILVDGKRSYGELCTGLGASLEASGALNVLIDEGFVEPVREPAPPSSPRSALLSMARSALGANAPKVLQMIERCEDDPEALATALSSACKLVKLTIDERKGDSLLAQGSALLQRYR